MADWTGNRSSEAAQQSDAPNAQSATLLSVTMAAGLTIDVLQDDIAVSLARVMAVANKHARESGVDAPQSLITITQSSLEGDLVWRISYGAKDYINRRGGD